MATSVHTIPHIPPALLPLLEDCVGRTQDYMPWRHSAEELRDLRGVLDEVAEDYGLHSPVYNRALILVAMEYSRAEVLL
jgi:hypothetical protein